VLGDFPVVILLELIYAIVKEINRQIGHKEIMDNSSNDIFKFNLESITGETNELVIKINIKLDDGKDVKYNENIEWDLFEEKNRYYSYKNIDKLTSPEAFA
jgi:hypothetical protein